MVEESMNSDIPNCIVFYRLIEKAHERYLISGKRSKFDVNAALEQLQFAIIPASQHICRLCHDKLRKRSGLLAQEKRIVSELKETYQKARLKRCQIPAEERGPTVKRLYSLNEDSSTISHLEVPSSPPSPQSKYLYLSLPPPISQSTPVKHPDPKPLKTSVNVKVTWPSRTSQKELQPDLEPLGKMLVRRTYKQIANAIWRNTNLRKHLIFNIMKDIDNECIGLCSKKNQSCLQSPDKDKMLDFSFEKQKAELETRAPLLFSVLVGASSCRTKRDEKDWILAVGMAASILLRNRSPYMNTIQLL